MDKHYEIAVCSFPNFGELESWKVWKTCSCCCNPFRLQTCLWCRPSEGNRDDRSAPAVQDEASLSPAATRAGFSMAPRPQVGNMHSSHSVAATIRPPEVGMPAITRAWLLGSLFGYFREGKELSEEILSNAVCSRIYWHLLWGSLNIMSVGLL